jgi:hypothetical protein
MGTEVTAILCEDQRPFDMNLLVIEEKILVENDQEVTQEG